MLKKIIYLNSGHSLSDPGAIYHGTTESKEVRIIRDHLVPKLKKSFEVLCVPDELNLIQSIRWVNKRAPKLDDGLAFSIHLNACGNCGAAGSEAYYYAGSDKSKKIAKTIIDKYCEITGYKNRGAKPDTSTRHKRLGWIRDVAPWSCLIECCFLDNKKDLEKLRDYDLIAEALYESLCRVWGIKPQQDDENALEDEIKRLKVSVMMHKERLNKIKDLCDL